MKKTPLIIILILSVALIISVSLPSKKVENVNNDNASITSDEIREIVREELKSELNNLEIKVENESSDVDYERIEKIVEDKLEDFNKDFGESFEEATSYFGGKIKGTVNDIESHMKK